MRGVPTGLLLPESFLASEFFQVLATFVAINSLVYVTLAVAKMLPRIHPTEWWPRRNRRREPRGIGSPPS